ncbi:maleylacetoacetate isomerase [Tistrella bauzanensis]|uniref:maleylacetoacetate isomerase n=1 Tax=Tistrella TaxID=171436 RepID=UPI0031F61C4E
MTSTAELNRAVFHGYFRSSAAYRCRIAFNLKGVAPEQRFVHLRKAEQQSPAFKAIAPAGLVPALDLSGGDGATVLTQSLAIIEWLNEIRPEPALLPADPWMRAQVRAFALTIACDIHPVNNLRILAYLKGPLGHDQTTADTWYRHWIDEGLTAAEALAQQALDAGTGGTFLYGDRPGLADLCLVPQIYNARRFNCPMGAYPRLVAVEAACNALPAFADALPERQPDAEG